MKKLMSVLAALVSALALAGVAAASPGHRGHSQVAAAAAYIGVDAAVIKADLKAGTSLAAIATAHGKTVDGLVAALIAPAKLKLDAAVAAGKLTSAREAKLLARLQASVTKAVNKTPKARAHRTHVRVSTAAILKPALAYLGLDFNALATQLRSGKTIGQVAVAQGKTAAGLVDAIVVSVKTTLDARVAAGKLSAADEATFLAQLQTNVSAFIS